MLNKNNFYVKAKRYIQVIFPYPPFVKFLRQKNCCIRNILYNLDNRALYKTSYWRLTGMNKKGWGKKLLSLICTATVNNSDKFTNSLLSDDNITVNTHHEAKEYKISNFTKMPEEDMVSYQIIRELLRKFFCNWQIYVKLNKDQVKQIQQEEKLAIFLQSLKQHQTQQQHNNKSSQNKCIPNKSSKSLDKREAKYNLNVSSYENRFKAQKQIIQFQKIQLLQQEKLIRELRLDTLQKEISQSLTETEHEIHKMFTNCSTKVKYKIKSPAIPTFGENISEFRLNSAKAPKIIQIVHQKSLEREHRRQMILEKKRTLDQMKKDVMASEIERQKVQDKEERKRNLKAIAERRKKELQIWREMQMKKQRFQEDCAKADHFYNYVLKKNAFNGFIKLIVLKTNNILKSKKYYELKLIQNGMKHWILFLNANHYLKFHEAEQFYLFKLKKKTLQALLTKYTLSIQNLQVAQDLYEMKLQSKTFVHWYKYISIQQLRLNKKLQKAQKHHESCILLHYFYLWKSLPAVILLEKTKEEKKRKWREKVWEILPDYQPTPND